MLKIEKANKDDIALIKELSMQVWPQTYVPILGEEQVAYMLNKFYSTESLAEQMQKHAFVILYDGFTAVGFASYELINKDVVKLHKIYVVATVQGKGYGKYLLQYVCGATHTLNAKYLQLNVNRYNTQAIGFYTKMGFISIAEEDIDIGNGYFMNDYVLRLLVA